MCASPISMGEKTVRALLHRLRGPYVGALNRSRLLGVIFDRSGWFCLPADVCFSFEKVGSCAG